MGAKLGQNNVKGEQTKIAILAAAEQVFAEAGYRGSSLQSIAERAGVTQSGLLHHFKTKDDLLYGVLEQHEISDDALLARPLSRGGTAVIDGLAELIGEYSSNRVAVRLFAVLAAESTAVEHPGHEYMRQRYEKLRNRLVGSLSVGLDPSKLAAGVTIDDLASALIAVIDGIQLQWIYNSEVDMGAAFDSLTMVLRGALTPSSPVN